MKEITVTIRDKDKEIAVRAEVGTPLIEIVRKAYPDKDGAGRFACAKKDRRLVELGRKIFEDDTYELVTTEDNVGFDMYKRSLVLLMLRAARDVFGDKKVELMYSQPCSRKVSI